MHARHRSRPAQLSPSPAPAAEPLAVAPRPVDGAASASELDDGDEAAPPSTPAPVADQMQRPPKAAATLSNHGRPPGLDRDSCVQHIDYPWRAKLLDKEGVVRLRVVLDADGRVREATVLQRAGYGFDETALAAVKTRCRFSAALDAAGRPTSFVIENYHFYFRVDDFDRQRALDSRDLLPALPAATRRIH